MMSAGAVFSADHACRSATEATTMCSPMSWRGLSAAVSVLLMAAISSMQLESDTPKANALKLRQMPQIYGEIFSGLSVISR